jgi:3-oxoacyl-[acyl-carrier protein] reductase
VAIVTGGGCAIGQEVARALASQGDAIIAVYLDHQSSADAAVEEVLAAGGTAVTVRADLADDLDVERLFTETIAMFDGVDLVVHTTAHDASVLYEQASRRLRPGSAIVSVSRVEHVTPRLAERLRERDITLNGASPGVEPPGADRNVTELLDITLNGASPRFEPPAADRNVTELLALVERWRHRRSGPQWP